MWSTPEEIKRKHRTWLTSEQEAEYKKLSATQIQLLEREYEALEHKQLETVKNYLSIPTYLARISALSGIPQELVEQIIGRMCAGLTIPFSEMVTLINSFFVVKRSIEEEQQQKEEAN